MPIQEWKSAGKRETTAVGIATGQRPVNLPRRISLGFGCQLRADGCWISGDKVEELQPGGGLDNKVAPEYVVLDPRAEGLQECDIRRINGAEMVEEFDGKIGLVFVIRFEIREQYRGEIPDALRGQR
ncbi:MAG: hypothetical protein ABIT37_18255 [Luteolibacter sp.]